MIDRSRITNLENQVAGHNPDSNPLADALKWIRETHPPNEEAAARLDPIITPIFRGPVENPA